MRTTIRIDDELYREVKQRAARSGRTIAAVLEDAVRRGLAPAARRPAGRYVIRPTGSGGLRPGLDLSSNAAVAEATDESTGVALTRS
jgi:plasmid stability protein